MDMAFFLSSVPHLLPSTHVNKKWVHVSHKSTVISDVSSRNGLDGRFLTHRRVTIHSFLGYENQFGHKTQCFDRHLLKLFARNGESRSNSSPKPIESEVGGSKIQEGDDRYCGTGVKEQNGAGEPNKESDRNAFGRMALAVGESLPPEGFTVFMACIVGFLTGISVVCFNLAVHEIRELFWDGIHAPGALWLRERPLEQNWQRIIFVPVCGGVVVGILNTLRSSLESPSEGIRLSNIKASFRSFLKFVAASVTLGTGNSLGPEGPSVEIGASIANGVGKLLQNSRDRKLSLVAAGSAAGISSGFNAAVAGCFFAVESVLWPSSADLSTSLTDATPMVILSAVIASVISQAGLGSEPAFTIPAYEFRSPAELPLYLLLGILCGLISVALSKSTKYAMAAFDAIPKFTGVPAALLPPLGGLFVGLIALVYPEVLYWGFENVDVLLESRTFVKGPPADLLLQLVGAKIVATSLSRAAGLVGGYYAPSLFIGAALGSAYGKLASYAVTHADPMFHLDALEVAAPQAYGLVAMAATLAGVCQVPLTSVLLLFELTRDYRIIIPLMGAVGLSSWIASASTRKRKQNVNVEKIVSSNINRRANEPPVEAKPLSVFQKSDMTQSILIDSVQSLLGSMETILYTNNLCELESSLCLANSDFEEEQLEESISVAAAMRTRYVAVFLGTSIREAMSLMLAEKEWCALVVDSNNYLKGILTLGDIQQYGQMARASGKPVEVGTLPVSAVCNPHAERGEDFGVLTAFPHMSLRAARQLMARRGLRQLPVVTEGTSQLHQMGPLVGLLDRESIRLACRAEATKKILGLSCSIQDSELQ